MKRLNIILGFIIFIYGTAFSQADSVHMNSSSEDYFKTQMDSMDNMWAIQQLEAQIKQKAEFKNEEAGRVKATLEFLEKDIPLTYSSLMWDFVRFYVSQQHSQTERLLGLSEKLLSEIDSIFISKGIPAELKYLALVQSAMNPHFVSEKGASGPWQFMYSTGSLYELEIDSYIDQRRDYIKSTIAAAEMLKDLNKIYNNWQLAVIAYNCGPSNLNRAIRRAKTHKNINEIYKHLPTPERDFYAAFVAMVFITENAEHLELRPAPVKWPVQTDTVIIDQKLHLGQVAAVLGLNIRLLHDLNPVYRRSVIPASYQKFTLKLPRGKKSAFKEMKDSIYNHRDTFFFQLKPEPELNSGKKYASYKPRSPSENHTSIYYTIKSGDNLGYISEWFDVSIRDLRYWNNIRGNMIRSGQRLLIYVPKDNADYYRQYDTLSFAEKEKREGKKVETPDKKPAKPLKEGEYTIYVVKSGDSAWSIAKKYPGISDQDILRWNNIRASDLRRGQKLKIKKQ
ncbi:MAG: LysM peptidoglycan-binding domain-containing protein [Bacteroidales bacterium]|nr:LysM peptidoglycan-binding domain-containing protein [Bacteroidales bacterium]